MGQAMHTPGFIDDLAEKLRFDDAALPSMPEAVQQIRQSLNGNGVTISKLSQIIQKDPVLATRIVRAGNSAIYRTVQPVESVSDAVMRMGLSRTQNIALVLLKNSFQARHKLIKDRIGWLWNESLHVASIAHVLADHYDFVSSDRAVLGGLLQNVGALLLLTIVDEKLSDLKHEAILDVMIKQYACEFGAKLLTHWEMDAELIAVAQNRNNWNRSHAEAADLADLILLAKSCLQYDIDTNYGLPEHQTLPAFEKLQASYPLEVELQKLIQDNNERIDSMRKMLSA